MPVYTHSFYSGKPFVKCLIIEKFAVACLILFISKKLKNFYCYAERPLQSIQLKESSSFENHELFYAMHIQR